MLFALALYAGTTPGLMRVEDFGAYWSAMKINLRGENPFDREMLLTGHREIEPDRQDVLPPWGGPGAMAVCLPFVALPFPLARILWLIVQAIVLMMCATMIWRAYRGPPDKVMIAWFLTFTFYPAWQLLSLGQVSLGNLVAIAGFVYFLPRKPFVAGLLVGFVICKPQAMMPFEWAVVLWCLNRRAWLVILGGLTTVGLAIAVVLIPNPHFFSQYAEAMATRGPVEMMQPTIATWLRLACGGAFWPALVLMPIAIIFVTIRYIRKRNDWDWQRELIWLVPLSYFATPYGWMHDVTVFLLPLLASVVRANLSRKVIALFVGCSLPALVQNALNREEYEFVWLPVALVGVVAGVSGQRFSSNV